MIFFLQLKSAGCQVLQSTIASATNLAKLDVSENSFDSDLIGLLTWVQVRDIIASVLCLCVSWQFPYSRNWVCVGTGANFFQTKYTINHIIMSGGGIKAETSFHLSTHLL